MSRRPDAVGRTRGRLIVVQVLVVSLLVTLFARLWYLQVVAGEVYQAQAASNAVRDVVVQPARGLIVDDVGRPLAANRTSWVVTVDSDSLDELEPRERRSVLRRTAALVGDRPRELRQRLRLCGTPGAPDPPICWNGSPYQPVPVAQDVSRRVAAMIRERPEDFVGVAAEQQNLRAYPSPFGINAAHLLGYLTPVTADEYEDATAREDESINSGTLVGRAGLERQYDRWLRGIPGATGKSVDASGRVIGEGDEVAPQPGDTLVTSIDARVQSVVERELREAVRVARSTRDEITGRDYEATSGAIIVLDPDGGRVVASASWPTYDPEVWVGGITERQLKRLYSKAAGEPLLSRPIQGQLSPGSTWKPIMTAGALANGYSRDSVLDCSPSFTVGNRSWANFESSAYGPIGFAQALQVSCNTFFYRIGYDLWLDAGGDSQGADADAVLADMARDFGIGEPTGIDLPSEEDGRVADPAWKQAYYEEMKGYYCRIARKGSDDAYTQLFSEEFCAEGYRYRAGDAVNFVIGQGDTIVTPMQLAVAYGALANGGTVYEPRVAKAVVDGDGEVVKRIAPTVAGEVPVSKADLDFIDQALLGTSRTGTMAWKLTGFPLDDVQIRSKTGTAEVYGRQTTGWTASYTDDFVVITMLEQGGTGSGSTGDAVRAIWEALYGVRGEQADPDRSVLPDGRPPRSLPVFRGDGTIAPPGSRRSDGRGGRDDDRDGGGAAR